MLQPPSQPETITIKCNLTSQDQRFFFPLSIIYLLEAEKGCWKVLQEAANKLLLLCIEKKHVWQKS